MKKKILTGLVLLGCISCLGLTGCGEKKIDLAKYITVSFSGMDKKGSASVYLDYDKLMQAISGKVSLQNAANAAYVTGSIEVTLNQTEYLQNGDTVKVACIYDNDIAKDLGVRLTFDEMEVTVSGLTAAKLISAEELLDAANIVLEGISPYGEAYFENEDNPYSFVYYNLDKYDNIANGDVLELSLNVDDYEAESQGYAVIGDESTKKLEVSGLPELITSFDEVSADGLKAIKQQASDVVEAWKANHRAYNYNYTATQPVRIFFLSAKDTEDFWGDANMLILIYKATEVNSSSGKAIDNYVAVSVENIVKNADGSNSCDLREIGVEDYEEDYNELYMDVIQSNMAEYNVSEYEFN